MIQFLENFNNDAFEVAELILHYFGLFLPFIITVVLFAVLLIGGILYLVDWIEGMVLAKKISKEEFDNNENKN